MNRKLNPINTDANTFELLTNSVKIDSEVVMVQGIMYDNIRVKISRYSLDDLLSQMLDDYGAEKLIETIKQLDKF